jgi:transketolase
VDEVAATKQALGWPVEPAFLVPDDVRERYAALGSRAHAERLAWERSFAVFCEKHPDRAATWNAMHAATPNLDPAGRPVFAPGKSVATRAASGKALAWLSPQVPGLWGGSADLAPSNQTLIDGESAFSRDTPAGRNLHFGVREHGMAAIMNGMALYGGLVPYGGTFLIFCDYLRPSLRLAALMGLRVIYVFTHDSIFLGEDGPTHQPIAQLAAMRAIPGMTVIRPCDAEETVQAWEAALHRSGPTALVLTRQGLPALDRAGLGIGEDVHRGAYVVIESPRAPELVAFATGSELAPTMEAAQRLNAAGGSVRVAAVPSWELFAEQDAAYREHVLAPTVTRRMAVEAATPFGWERFTGLNGTIVGMRRFGASAPAPVLAEKFGFTPDAIETAMRETLDRA